MPEPFSLTCTIADGDSVEITADGDELSIIAHSVLAEHVVTIYSGPGTARALLNYLTSVLDPTPSPAPATPAPTPLESWQSAEAAANVAALDAATARFPDADPVAIVAVARFLRGLPA